MDKKALYYSPVRMVIVKNMGRDFITGPEDYDKPVREVPPKEMESSSTDINSLASDIVDEVPKKKMKKKRRIHEINRKLRHKKNKTHRKAASLTMPNLLVKMSAEKEPATRPDVAELLSTLEATRSMSPKKTYEMATGKKMHPLIEGTLYNPLVELLVDLAPLVGDKWGGRLSMIYELLKKYYEKGIGLNKEMKQKALERTLAGRVRPAGQAPYEYAPHEVIDPGSIKEQVLKSIPLVNLFVGDKPAAREPRHSLEAAIARRARNREQGVIL